MVGVVMLKPASTVIENCVAAEARSATLSVTVTEKLVSPGVPVG